VKDTQTGRRRDRKDEDADGGGGGLERTTTDWERSPPRLHHLEWLRALSIIMTVFFHLARVFVVRMPVFSIDNTAFPQFLDENSTEFSLLNQDTENWRRDDHTWRYQQIGRQFGIPLLFWISGCSLGLSTDRHMIDDSMRKVLLITLVGCFCNSILWGLGPMDSRCGYWDRHSEECSGILFDYVVAPGVAGAYYGIVFQFWFTLFLLVFLMESHMILNALRDTFELVRDYDTFPPQISARTYVRCAFAVGIKTCLYVMATFSFYGTPGEEPPHKTGAAVVIGLMEIPFVGLLLIAVSATSSHVPAIVVRLAQYLAAVVAIFQFCLFQIPPTDRGGEEIGVFDGRHFIYFHIFKQMMLLGYVMSLTRARTSPVLSRAYPVVFLLLALTFPSTNYYRAGMVYPWYPNLVDRLLFTSGSFLQLFIHDRLGICFAEARLHAPLYPSLGLGALLAYIFHPPVIALMAPILEHFHPMAATGVVFGVFVVVAEPVGRAIGHKRPASIMVATGCDSVEVSTKKPEGIPSQES